MSNDANGPVDPRNGDASVPPPPPTSNTPPTPPTPPQQPYGQTPPPQPYGQPVPPQQPYGQTTPQQSYGQPGYGGAPYGAPGYAGPMQSNITLNLWLSVFFMWVPALIFYLVEKDRVPAPYHRANAANLNYQIVVAIAYAAGLVLSVITLGFGGIVFIFLPIAQLILGIIHAINVPTQLASGREGKFYLAPPWVK